MATIAILIPLAFVPTFLEMGRGSEDYLVWLALTEENLTIGWSLSLLGAVVFLFSLVKWSCKVANWLVGKMYPDDGLEAVEDDA